MDKLTPCTYDNTQTFTIEGSHLAKVLKVYDGDTITVALCLFGEAPRKFSCRCLHYNSAEVKSKDPVEKEKALAARDYLRSCILDRIVNLNIQGMDKYGRLLVEIENNGVNINKDMLKKGYGKPYEGVGEKNY